MLAAYEAYEFHVVYHALNNFCSVDLSAIYLDVREDALYCEQPDAPIRRASQTVLAETLEALVRVMAPILSYTAEEIWSHLPRAGRPESVFLAAFPTETPAEWRAKDVAADYDRLLQVRAAVTKTLEDARRDGTVKQATEARAVLRATGELEALPRARRAVIVELCLLADLVIDPRYKEPFTKPTVPSFGWANREGKILDIMDTAKMEALAKDLRQARRGKAADRTALIVFGSGSAIPELSKLYDLQFYYDTTKESVLWTMWDGLLTPFGATQAKKTSLLSLRSAVPSGRLDYFAGTGRRRPPALADPRRNGWTSVRR